MQPIVMSGMAASEIVSLQGMDDGRSPSLDVLSHLYALGQVDINQMKPNAQSEERKGIVSIKSDVPPCSKSGIRHKAISRVVVELTYEILEPSCQVPAGYKRAS